ncbi:unnamed protein product [Lupinus luteus]|uniref:Protein kinase domain-containing protein n=1 Tax=Lupinus luteus TaxID=3873 RepID=A0AAV1XCN8_LUPLU
MTITEMSPLTALLIPLLLVLPFLSHASTSSIKPKSALDCYRSCGIHNISRPFRLKDSPDHCGDLRYNLSCQDNQLVQYWNSGKYYVQSINYNNLTIRLVDANIGLHNYSSPPSHSLGAFSFINQYNPSEPYQNFQFQHTDSIATFYIKNLTKLMIYLRCPYPMSSSDGTASCMNDSIFYVNVGNKSLWDLGLGDSCHIEFMYLTSWPAEYYNQSNISCTDIHNMMLYGFEVSWQTAFCDVRSLAIFDDHGNPHCSALWPFIFRSVLLKVLFAIYASIIIISYFAVRWVITTLFIIIFLCILKCRRKHLSMYINIEDFLRGDNGYMMPIRYSYKDIKRITEGFKIKLGSGGFGSVFKGQLRSGRLVAVKVLDKAKASGQDFINEVATIGTTHHVNVVQLIGFCVDGSKRALIYEFMPNGSLEKYIFSHEDGASLSCEMLYSISLGIARGIEYLHNGCNMKILHFDIKPHNILLDANFNPKVSDFGLAKLYPTDDSIVSLTDARGTIGYMAPELYYRNIGTISYKADVYSFGMLLMEMAGRRKNLNALAEHSSQVYYPFWVYDQLHDGKEITTEKDTDEEMRLATKMMIVALHCIQTRPNDRPSMNKVLEMLDGDEDLPLPSKPYLYPQDTQPEDVIEHISSRERLEHTFLEEKVGPSTLQHFQEMSN